MQPPNEKTEPRDEAEQSKGHKAVHTRYRCGSYKKHIIYGAKPGRGFIEQVLFTAIEDSEHCRVQGPASRPI